MKTSWKKAKRWDEHLLQRAPPEEELVVAAELILDPDLSETLRWQQRTHVLARLYGRQQLRQEIQAAQHQLFHHPEHRSFQRMIRRLFS